jgi:two-component system NarL family sensor kinase
MRLRAHILISIGLAIFGQSSFAQAVDCARLDSLIEQSYRLEAVNLDSAFKLMAQLEQIAAECDDQAKVHAFIRMASVLEELGRVEDALELAMNAHRIAKANADPSLLARSCSNLGNLYATTRNYDLAHQYLEQAIDLAREGEFYEVLTRALINDGLVVVLSDTAKAIAMLEEAEVLSRQYSTYLDRYTVQHNLATLYAIIGDFEHGVQMSLRMLRDPGLKKDLTSEFYVTLNLGFMYQDLGMIDSGEYYLRKASRIDPSKTGFEESAYANFGLYELYRFNGQYDSALHYYIKADVLLDSALNRSRLERITELRETFEAELRESEIRSLETENAIASLQRNLFFALALALILIAVAIYLVYSNRLKTSRLLAEQQIQQLEKEKEVLSLQSMLVAQEDERQRIARDLHDSIGALLSAAKLHITNIVAEVQRLEELDFLKSTEAAIDRANQEIRRVAHDMMPGVLMKLGLTEGIEDFIDRLREASDLEVALNYDEIPERFDNKREVMIYRIVQELVNNTVKHAEAHQIIIDMRLKEDRFVLDYRDDGQGFDPARLEHANSFGLSSLRSRINYLNGTMDLDSGAGKGVHFHFEIPLV